MMWDMIHWLQGPSTHDSFSKKTMATGAVDALLIIPAACIQYLPCLTLHTGQHCSIWSQTACRPPFYAYSPHKCVLVLQYPKLKQSLRVNQVGLSISGSAFGWAVAVLRWVRKPSVISCKCRALLVLIIAGRRDKASLREDVSIASLLHF